MVFHHIMFSAKSYVEPPVLLMKSFHPPGSSGKALSVPVARSMAPKKADKAKADKAEKAAKAVKTSVGKKVANTWGGLHGETPRKWMKMDGLEWDMRQSVNFLWWWSCVWNGPWGTDTRFSGLLFCVFRDVFGFISCFPACFEECDCLQQTGRGEKTSKGPTPAHQKLLL